MITFFIKIKEKNEFLFFINKIVIIMLYNDCIIMGINVLQGGIMLPTTTKVAPGLTLSCIRTHKFKTGILSFTIPFSLSREHLIYNSLLPGVLRQGTESCPTMAALNRRLDELYASCVELRSQRLGKNLTLTLGAELLDDEYAPEGANILEGVLTLIHEILFRPKLEDGLFRKKAVDQEIRFATDSIRGEINNTRGYSIIRLGELMHREDPDFLTLKELEAGIQKVDQKALTDFYRSCVLSAPVQVFYVGSMEEERVAALLRRIFADVGGKDYIPLLPEARKASPLHEVTEAMPVAQGKLAMGFRTGVCMSREGDRTPAMLLFNEIFGGSPISKLFMNVRERMNLCYYCSSAYNRYSGILSVSSGIDSKNVEVVKSAVLEQLEEIREGRITEAEFDAAKKSLENYCRTMDDNPSDLQVFYSSRAFFGISETPEDYLDRLLSVTLEEVVGIAKEIELDTVYFIEGTKQSEEQEGEEDE